MMETVTTDDGLETPYDHLTGLATRFGLEQFLEGLSTTDDAPLSIASVEMARFGTINDSMGGELGNRIIATTAKRLKKVFSDALIIARTHGDHFCLVFNGYNDLEKIVERLRDFTQRPLVLGGNVIVLSVRVGFADSSQVQEPVSLFNAAETALHRAKIDDQYALKYEASITSQAKSLYKLENDLRISLVTKNVELHRALHNDEFKLLYQPIIHPKTGAVDSYEALIRWEHPTRGVVSPSEFIPVAEKIQAIDVLSNWVMRTAMRDADKFPKNPDGTKPGVSINVSSVEFQRPEILLMTFRQALSESGLDPHLVKIEITESAALSTKMEDTVSKIRETGCRVALDDFGTGYSSFTQLAHLPIDILKIDRSFVSDLDSNDQQKRRQSEQICRAIIALADAFNLETIVEGVETEEQLNRLINLGATLVQGYVYSRPISLDQILHSQQSKGN